MGFICKRIVKRYFIWLILFAMFTELPANAYIDPGTGSMLFSVVICSITTVYFLFNMLIIKIKRLFFLKDTKSESFYPFVIYSEGNQYYPVFKPVIDEFEKRKIPLMYFTSAQNDYIFNENYNFVKSKYIGKSYNAYLKLAFLRADVCLMTTPQLDVLQLKRSKYTKHYSHIYHSIGISMGYRMFALDYYDSVLCDAEFQIPLIRQTENKRKTAAKELKVVGSTYMDYYQEKLEKLKIKKNTEYTILIAPTWGKDNLFNKCGTTILDNLSNTEYRIIIRPHPQSMIVEKNLIEEFQARYKDSKNIEWDFKTDNIESLSKADLLISDFSCVMLDYAFLFKKPFLYIDAKIDLTAMDCCDLDELPPWRSKILNIIGKEIRPNESDTANITKIIKEIKQDKNLKQKIIDACNYAWEEKGKAKENVVDFLVEIQKKVSEK